MKFEELQTVLFEAVEASKTQLEGLTLFDKFSNEEVGDFVVDIAHSLPKYPDLLVEDVKQRVLQVFTEEELELHLTLNIRHLFRLQLVDKLTREQEYLLVFYLMFSYKTRHTENSLTKDLQDIREYFTSYIIHNTNELLDEINENPNKGETKIVGNYYIRIKDNFELIPTRTTSINFTNYL